MRILSAVLVVSLWASVADAASSENSLNNKDVINMLKAGIGEALVTAKIKKSKCAFDLAPNAMIELKNNGVSDEIIELMLQQQMEQKKRLRSRILLAIQQLASENQETRDNAYLYLKQLETMALPAMREALTNERAAVRAAVAVAVGRLHDHRSAPFLRELMTDQKQEVRFAAAESLAALEDEQALLLAQKSAASGVNPLDGYLRLLGHRRDDQSVGFLVVRLLKDMNEQTRAQAAWSLGEIGSARACQALSEALLEDRETVVQRECAVALGKIGQPDSVEVLIKACKNFPAIRREVLLAIGKYPAHASVEFLIVALGQKLTPDESHAALTGLRRLTSRDFGRDIERWRVWWAEHRDEILRGRQPPAMPAPAENGEVSTMNGGEDWNTEPPATDVRLPARETPEEEALPPDEEQSEENPAVTIERITGDPEMPPPLRFEDTPSADRP